MATEKKLAEINSRRKKLADDKIRIDADLADIATRMCHPGDSAETKKWTAKKKNKK